MPELSTRGASKLDLSTFCLIVSYLLAVAATRKELPITVLTPALAIVRAPDASSPNSATLSLTAPEESPGISIRCHMSAHWWCARVGGA